jgi:predicted SAM-dependent methyltransferase
VSPGRYPGHLTLYNIDILSELLRDEGFQVRPLEFFDTSGKFHERFWSPQNGAVMRSRHRDPRNADGRLRFTSLIVDGVKPSDIPISYKFTLGAATVPQHGWNALNPLEFLSVDGQSLTNEYTPCGKAIAVVTEHWIDKLSLDERTLTFKKLHEILAPGGRVRIAVRDANFPNEDYQRMDPHHPAMSLQDLVAELRTVGFTTRPLEWFDPDGQFHARPWQTVDGFIQRSKEFDTRNRDALNYTSLILDGVKA